MTVIYQLDCFGCDILVRQQQESYHLGIQSRSNPLGLGNRLAEFDSEEDAVGAADHFCRMYKLMREYGYRLSGEEFQKDDMPSIPVKGLLNLRPATNDLRALLERDAELYGAATSS